MSNNEVRYREYEIDVYRTSPKNKQEFFNNFWALAMPLAEKVKISNFCYQFKTECDLHEVKEWVYNAKCTCSHGLEIFLDEID